MGPAGPMPEAAYEVLPPPLDYYFLVGFNGMLFHGAIASDPRQVTDLVPLMNQATAGATAPDVFGFAFQMPLFNTGGNTGTQSAALLIRALGTGEVEISVASFQRKRVLLQPLVQREVQCLAELRPLWRMHVQVHESG